MEKAEQIEFIIDCTTPYGMVKRKRYRCGNCGYVSNMKSHRFCPDCGREYIRVDKRTKAYREVQSVEH